MRRLPAITVAPARVDWLDALTVGDDVFTARFGIAVRPGWIGFPDALAPALAGARAQPDQRWGSHLVFDGADGALVGFAGYKGPPRDGEVEIGYAVAPDRRGRGIATATVATFTERARAAAVTTVSAHTLAVDNPSTAVLRRCGFRRVAALPDDELGAIWRWELHLPTTTTTNTTNTTKER